MSGPLALVGGAEWREGCSFDKELLDTSGASEVVILPTAAAYEGAAAAVDTATRHFTDLGVTARGLMVLKRHEAEDAANAETVRRARFIYIGGGSPLHLRSVLKESALWTAMVEAWHDGAVLAGSSAGAMVMCDPMLDPRGGAFTLGLGLVAQLAVIPHADTWTPERAKRTVDLAPTGTRIVAIDEQTAAIREPDGTWRAAGLGQVRVWVDGKAGDLATLA